MPPTTPSKSSFAKKVQVSPSRNRPRSSGRAKSGCFTCRIRRKKCDELRVGDETGPCSTCIRLKLECLGFGAKRPDWMRAPGVVTQIRDRIKDYLASQGMIKGHSATGSKIQVPGEFLQLSDLCGQPADVRDYPSGSSSTDSPVSGREDSVESENMYAVAPLYNQYQQSSIRGYEYFGHSDVVPTRCDSPMDPSQYSYSTPFYPMVTADNFETPATRSQLSTLYHAQFTIDAEPEYEYDAMDPSPSIIFPSNILPDYLINDSMRDYVSNIVKIQYLLGDKLVLPEMIWEAVGRHEASKEAVSLLSLAYYSRQADRNSFMLQDQNVQHRVSKLREMLVVAEARFNADDAMAALHIVSLYLFDGGQGRWDEFLNFACSYTVRVLDNPHYLGNYPDALESAGQKDEFVIKTTIWFDVIASITTMKPPRLLKYIRQLFAPTLSWPPRKYSMLSPMGCENAIVWALAETSNLAYLKARSLGQGNLSIRQLVNSVQEIEPYLLPRPRPIEPRDGPEGWSRYLTSEIFRTSTRLFLKSVESGDHPYVPDIRICVQETFTAIVDIPPVEAGLDCLDTSAVIRSTVFAFYICGSLTDSESILNALQLRLTQKPSDEGVGNTTTISDLLTTLWDERRMQAAGRPVRWRRLLRRREILLV